MLMKSLMGHAVAVLILSFTGVLNVAAAEKSPVETAAETREAGQLAVSSDTFSCIRDMTKVRGFYVDNLKGDLEGTLAVANSESGGIYPPGSVVQLVPGEVMISMKKAIALQQKAGSFLS